MQQNFGAHDDSLSDIRRAARPFRVFVGRADELPDAQKLRVEFQSQRNDVPVFILPGFGHSDMLTCPDGIRVVVAAFP
jgi:pimeloyl-ACP methyl ester carboxylesterase